MTQRTKTPHLHIPDHIYSSEQPMQIESPALAPAAPTRPTLFYLVWADFGSLGATYVEREPQHMDWQNTVRQLAEGEWRDVRQVVEVDLVRGTSADVTDKAMLAARLAREGVYPI